MARCSEIKKIIDKLQRKLRRKYHWNTWNQLWRSNSCTRSYRLIRDEKYDGTAYTGGGKLVKCKITREIQFTFYPDTDMHEQIVEIVQRKEYRNDDGRLIDVEHTKNMLTFEELQLVVATIESVYAEDIARRMILPKEKK